MKGLVRLMVVLVLVGVLNLSVVTAVLAAVAQAAVLTSDPLTPETMAGLAGALLALALKYIPRLGTRYEALPGDVKATIMGFLILVTGVGVYAASCGQLIDVGVTCDQQGLWTLAKLVIATLISNQATFLVAVAPFSKRRRAARELRLQLERRAYAA